jgi:hypothetical protein
MGDAHPKNNAYFIQHTQTGCWFSSGLIWPGDGRDGWVSPHKKEWATPISSFQSARNLMKKHNLLPKFYQIVENDTVKGLSAECCF